MSGIPMEVQELYATVLGSLLVFLLGWQIAKVGDAFRRRGVQVIRKNLLQTLIVTRKRGSSNYTLDAGVAILLLLVGNIIAICLHVRSLHDVTERLRAIFYVNLIPLYMDARTPILAEKAFGLTFTQHGLIHRSLGWICLIEGLGYTLLTVASEHWTVRSYNFAVS